MKKPLLGVDVDLTVVSTDKGWYDYLKYYNGFAKTLEKEGEKLPYNLSKVFPHVKEPMLYWKTLDYFQFEPLEGSVKALQKLSEHFDIVFISQQSGNHGKSKYYWLDEWFPFKSAVVLTHEKWVMNSSVVAMIDDRLNHLSGFDLDKRILFETPYTQDVEIDVATSFGVWDDTVVETICGRYL